MIRARLDTPLGAVLLTVERDALTELRFKEGAESDAKDPAADCTVLRDAARWLSVYFSGRQPDFLPKLSEPDSPFQAALREALLSVPYGETVSYSDLAVRLHSSPRAIGQAVANNPILLIVPCHRVVGKDGSLTGYAGGIERKTALLGAERDKSGKTD